MRVPFLLVVSIGLAFGATTAFAADAPPAQTPKSEQHVKVKRKKPMKMNEPIANEMKKEGMTKGEVKEMAEKKEAEMKPLMEEEEKKMPSK